MATIFKLENNKYRAQVFLFGKRKSKVFQTKSEARRWALEQEVAKGVNLKAASALKVGQFVEKFIEERGVDRHFACTLRMLARSEECDRPIRDVTTDHINAWIDSELQRISPQTGNTIKSSSVSRRLQSFSTFFNWAVEQHLIPTNPVRGHKKLKEVPHRERVATPEEIERLLYCCNWDGKSVPKTKRAEAVAAFLLACNTGMRSREMMLIERSWIDGDTLKIPQKADKIKVGRVIALNHRAKELIQLIAARGRRARIFSLNAAKRDAHWRAVRDAAGLGPVLDSSGNVIKEGLNFHDSRATFCTWAASPGPNGAPRLDVMTLARQTGHKNLKTLMKYYRPTMSEVASRLDK